MSRDTTARWSRVAHEHEQEDPQLYEDTDLQGVEEHKSVILQLLSQLKLGMDLTKGVLPTFILEKRSLLELFADCMAHPQLFLRVTDQPDAEARMLAVLEWYLTSFHAGRQVRAQVRMHTTHACMKSLKSLRAPLLHRAWSMCVFICSLRSFAMFANVCC